MTLNHLTLVVEDVHATKEFLMRYFNMKDGGGNKGMSLLRDDQGIALVLMKGKAPAYPSHFHIGFGQPSREQVDAINDRMKADGFSVTPPGQSHAYTFYVQAPGGFLVEVMA